MQELLNSFGLTTGELVSIAMLGAAALLGLLALRSILKLTATILRLGCALIVIGVIIVTLLSVLN